MCVMGESGKGSVCAGTHGTCKVDFSILWQTCIFNCFAFGFSLLCTVFCCETQLLSVVCVYLHVNH